MSDEKVTLPGGVQEPGPPGLPAVDLPEERSVVCPRCGLPTDHLKTFDVPLFAFLFVQIIWQTESVTACPACMRGVLFRKFLVSIPFANLLLPIPAAIYLGQLAACGVGGHTDPDVANQHRLTRGERLALQQGQIKLRKTPRREWVYLTLLLLLVALFWWGALAYQRSHRTPEQTSPPEPVPVAPQNGMQGGHNFRMRLTPELRVGFLLRDLASGKPEVRQRAAIKLAELGPKAARAVPKLRELSANDPDETVRLECERALHAIDAKEVPEAELPPK